MEIENITVTRMLDIDAPNPVKGKVVARQNKNRYFSVDKVFVQLDMQDNPIIVLNSTLPMNVRNLEVDKTYTFRRYNLFYNKEYTGTHQSSFCFDRGQEFSEVGKTGKIRYYQAEELLQE